MGDPLAVVGVAGMVAAIFRSTMAIYDTYKPCPELQDFADDVSLLRQQLDLVSAEIAGTAELLMEQDSKRPPQLNAMHEIGSWCYHVYPFAKQGDDAEHPLPIHHFGGLEVQRDHKIRMTDYKNPPGYGRRVRPETSRPRSSRSAGLSQHMYSCLDNQCSQRQGFRLLSDLRRHEMRVHLVQGCGLSHVNSRAWPCGLCDKRNNDYECTHVQQRSLGYYTGERKVWSDPGEQLLDATYMSRHKIVEPRLSTFDVSLLMINVVVRSGIFFAAAKVLTLLSIFGYGFTMLIDPSFSSSFTIKGPYWLAAIIVWFGISPTVLESSAFMRIKATNFACQRDLGLHTMMCVIERHVRSISKHYSIMHKTKMAYTLPPVWMAHMLLWICIVNNPCGDESMSRSINAGPSTSRLSDDSFENSPSLVSFAERLTSVSSRAQRTMAGTVLHIGKAVSTSCNGQ